MPNSASPRDLAVGIPASAIAGLLVGTLGTFKHQVGISAATGAGLPIGLVLSIAMVVLFVAALRLAFDTRLYAAAAWVGAVVAIAVLSQPGPGGGSTVIIGNAVGAVWIIAPALLAAGVVAWPCPRLRAPSIAGGILESGPARPAVDAKDD